MAKEFRLPDGNYTNDVELFSNEWDKLRKPFESIGLRVCGFDPGISLCDAKSGNGHFQIPIYAAMKFVSFIAAPSSNKSTQKP